jgi:class 3 adenylate cyclase/predicted ATPase
MECSNCGGNAPERAKFCSHCGFSLMPRCPACGTTNGFSAKFCSECGTTLNPAVPSSAAAIAADDAFRVSPAERRHLTVMFCDLADSTLLSTRLELEDLQHVLGAYHDSVSEVVTRFGGFVARRVGDGVLIYFGYPYVDEDDAEQAVRAGLALISAIQDLKVSEPLQVRIGIATGVVVVDESAQQQEVLGEGPNLAARLHTLAEPNTIVIADSTRRLLGSIFEIEDLGVRQLKGFAGPQRSWRVLGESRVRSRFEALRSPEAELVGRDEEIDLLLRRWAEARTGEGRVFLLSADPGVGKSRLTMAMTERLAADPHTTLRYFCLPHHEDSALHPIIFQLERAARFEREDTAEAKLDKIEALLSTTSLTKDDLALLVDLLLLPTERYRPAILTPRQKREKTFEVLLQQLTDLAKHRPVLMIIEDLHWMDPSTHELFDLTVERVKRLPILLIATFRPEFIPPWAGQSHVTAITLSRLNRHQSGTLVRQLAVAKEELSEDEVEQIVERADGVPLFLEEVTKAVLETGVSPIHVRDNVPEVLGRISPVPPALYASLLARLDRLGPAPKETAQIASVIGREFPYELLRTVAQRPEADLNDALTRLLDGGLIFQRGELPRADFSFKHSLVQDVAYNTLLRGSRQSLHARIAQGLESIFSDDAANRPEVIARHLTEAGLGERAISYWKRAGELALHRSSGGEAVTHLRSALRILAGLPDTPEVLRRELEIRLALVAALNIARSSSAPEAAEHSARAVELARRIDDDRQLFRALWGSWFVKASVGQTEQALSLANELFEVAERLADRDLLLEAYHSRWATSQMLGLNSATLADTARGLALYESGRHHAHAYDYGGHDTGVCAYTHRAMTLWITGFPDQAARLSLEALELGRRLGHPPSLAHAAWWSAMLRQLLREPDACRELCYLTIRIAREQGNNIYMMCPLLLGWVRFEIGNIADGLQHMRQAVAAKRQRGHRLFYEYELLVFAEALLKAGEPAQALEVVEEALTFIKASRNCQFESEAHRLKGVCFAMLPGKGIDESESLLRMATETAARRGALSLELRAGTSLARFWRDRSRREEARALLAPIYNRFTEGYQTSDMKDAEALLGK